jgi:Ni,Fe-hydrogenase III small subunit/ferredoxin
VSLWVLRGLRDGVVTTRWPKKPDPYADGWRGPAVVRDPVPAGLAGLSGLCPTRAITVTEGTVRLDQGRCILCGRCVDARPDVFSWSAGATGRAASALTRDQLVVPETPESAAAIEAARAELGRRTAALRRSVHLRHVDAGSDGTEEWEILALLGPVYDVHRLGIFLTPSPRHADILLVTGAGSHGMAEPLRRTVEATPRPLVVIAAGTDAISGGLIGPESAPHYAVAGGIGEIVEVDVWVPGSPPSPFSLLHALLLATGRIRPEGR